MADSDNQSKSNSEEYKKHTKKYTKLLKNYITHTESSNTIKNFYKKIFFWAIIGIMVILTVLFLITLYSAINIIKNLCITEESMPMENIIALITTVISSFLTMLVSLFKLPKIIAEYLFNPEEDKNMAAIIGHIQAYDIGMYKIEMETEKEMMKELQDTVENNLNDFIDETTEPIGNPSDLVHKQTS